jgi:glycogen debranching enzyme
VKEAEEVYQNTGRYEEGKRARIRKAVNNIATEKVNIAYNAARINLDNLTDDVGIFAGFPWFFQYWARDELISLKAYYEINKNQAEDFLKRWVKLINEKFCISSKVKIDGNFEGNSVDAIGWLFKRLELYPEVIQENKEKLFNFFNHLDDSFIETRGDSWMDSIQRVNGVELQAMKLYILKFASKLDNKKSYVELENCFREKLKKKYFADGKLIDADDQKIRPNIFIVYYFCPELFSKEEWEKIFDEALNELWLDWEGLRQSLRTIRTIMRIIRGKLRGVIITETAGSG